MPSLAGLLNPGTPEIDAFNAAQELERKKGTAQIGQLSSLAALMQHLQAGEKAQRAEALQAQFRTEMAGAKTPEEQIAIGIKYGGPEAAARTAASHLDRQAALQAANTNKEAQREQFRFQIEERGRQKLDEIEKNAAERRITQEQAAAERRALAESMARLTASLHPERQPSAPIATDQGLFERTPTGLRPMMNPNNPNQQLRPSSLVSGGNQQSMTLRRFYDSNPEVKLANSLEPKVGPTADYVASVGRGMGNAVGDAELVKLWLMTTHPKGDQISNLDYRTIEKMPDLFGRIKNVAGNFVFGKTLDADTRRDMWKSVSEKFKATDAMRQSKRQEVLQRAKAMNLNEEAIFPRQEE